MTVAQGDAGTAQRDEKCNPFLKERLQFLHKAKKKLRVSNEALSEATPALHTYTDIEITGTRGGALAVAQNNKAATRWSVLLPIVIVLN